MPPGVYVHTSKYKLEERICVGCNEVFSIKENSDHIFCSMQCFDKNKYELYKTLGFKKGHPNYAAPGAHIGQICWAKGLTKETDSRVATIAMKQTGRARSKATCENISKGKKGKKNPKHSLWVREHQSGINNSFYGRHHTESTKKLISDKHIGLPNPNPYGRGKAGYRSDLGHIWFRSTWEANLARVLNSIGTKWEYEKHGSRIRLYDENKNLLCSYLPDFYLPDAGFYIEVKGGIKGKRDKKLDLLYKMDSGFPIKVLDGEGYKKLAEIFKYQIPLWEK